MRCVRVHGSGHARVEGSRTAGPNGRMAPDLAKCGAAPLEPAAPRRPMTEVHSIARGAQGPGGYSFNGQRSLNHDAWLDVDAPCIVHAGFHRAREAISRI